jgi:hypothetical protein
MAFDFVSVALPRISLMLLGTFTMLAYFVLLNANFAGRFLSCWLKKLDQGNLRALPKIVAWFSRFILAEGIDITP